MHMTYLFTRQLRLAPGNLLDSMAWSAKITEKVNAISEMPVSLWTTVFSPKLGTLAWTVVVEDLSQLEALDAKLLADSGYTALTEEGARYTSDAGVDDSLISLVHADPDAATGDRQYAGVVEAVLAPGSAVRGIELGVEIAQRAKTITGRPTSFGIAQTGVYGAVEWIALYDSVDQVQKAEGALAADAGFAELLDKEASKAYLPSGSTQTMYRRVI
jgi:hypothetical protein